MNTVNIPGTKCDFCHKPAEYDGPTIYGPWAYTCEKCSWRLAKKVTKINSKEERYDSS